LLRDSCKSFFDRIGPSRASCNVRFSAAIRGEADIGTRTGAASITDEQYRQFVASDAFAEVPIVWLEVALLTRVMTAHSTRTIKQGDMTDIDAMATYLPYCDIYGADRFIAEVARSLGVPERYSCHLFDSRQDGGPQRNPKLMALLDVRSEGSTDALAPDIGEPDCGCGIGGAVSCCCSGAGNTFATP
jgi:hypothetical protein